LIGLRITTITSSVKNKLECKIIFEANTPMATKLATNRTLEWYGGLA